MNAVLVLLRGNKSFIELRGAAAEPCDKLTAITK